MKRHIKNISDSSILVFNSHVSVMKVYGKTEYEIYDIVCDILNSKDENGFITLKDSFLKQAKFDKCEFLIRIGFKNAVSFYFTNIQEFYEWESERIIKETEEHMYSHLEFDKKK